MNRVRAILSVAHRYNHILSSSRLTFPGVNTPLSPESSPYMLYSHYHTPVPQLHHEPVDATDVVEDSEPEREERRRKQKVVKKPRAKQSSCKGKGADVIELLDSSDEEKIAHKPNRFQAVASIIDISDDSISPSFVQLAPIEQGLSQTTNVMSIAEDEGPQCTRLDAVSVTSSKEQIFGIPFVNQDISNDTTLPSAHELLRIAPQTGQAGPSSPRTVPPQDLTDTEEEDSNQRFNLGQFAYSNPKASLRGLSSVGTSRSGSAISLDTQSRPASKNKKVATHCFTDISESELARLLKCVCCDLSWTTRKTVAQKMKHIQTCRKKNKLSDETVRILIRQQIEVSLPTDKGKGKAVEAEAPAAPRTLLEDVLNEGAGKKKGRRPQVIETVKSPTDTREGILAKARLLLDPGPSTGAEGQNVDIMANLDPEEPPAIHSPPRTQPFGDSALAQMFRSKAPRIREPSPTQAYVPTPLHSFTGRGSHTSPTAGRPAHLEDDLTESNKRMSAWGTRPSSPSDRDDLAKATKFVFTSQGPHPGSCRVPIEIGSSPQAQPMSFDGPVGFYASPAREAPQPAKLNPTFIPFPSPSSNEQIPWFPSTVKKNLSKAVHSPTAFDDTQRKTPTFTPEYDDRFDFPSDGVYTNDDACLHFLPEDDFGSPYASFHGHDTTRPQGSENANLPPLIQLSPSTHNTVRTSIKSGQPSRQATDFPDPQLDVHARAASSSKQRSKSTSRALATQDPINKPATTKKPRKKRGEQAAAEDLAPVPLDISDRELYTKLRQCILDDTALHHRVLRYEPVHFDTFLKLAIDLGVSSRGLKTRVRAFLDQQAIHFYGQDTSGSRTKK